MIFGTAPTAPTIQEVAARARQTSAIDVVITVELSGPAGSRKSTVIVPVADLAKLDPAAKLIEQIRSAVGAYERLEQCP